MVVQQNEPIQIWGKYTPGGSIKISGSWGNSKTTSGEANGNWKASLDAPAAGGPFTIEIKTQDSTIIISDVLSGEVWLASGQSNMGMPLKGWPPNDPIDNSAAEIEAANYPQIREYEVTRIVSKKELDNVSGKWVRCTPETAGNFGASAYFFARRLHQELNVPIGIIRPAWGGTPAESWASGDALAPFDEFKIALASLDNEGEEEKEANWYGSLPKTPQPTDVEGWFSQSFQDENFKQQNFNDEGWDKLSLPARFDKKDHWEIDGVFWLRTTFELTDLAKTYTLNLGAIDDMDQTYINGQLVGQSDVYNAQRNYIIPKELLKSGQNTIAIRVIDTGGPGSFTGGLSLAGSNGQSISLNKEWQFKPIAEMSAKSLFVLGDVDLKDRPNFIKVNQHTPSVLYNGMIHPLIPYKFKGTIWYQGESNVGREEQYETLFPTMINNWRSDWDDDFPFYFVQIAPFNYQKDANGNDRSQKLRDAQRKSLVLKNTGMVVTADIGNNSNIHPGNKQDVGGRLAGLALKNEYHKNIIASGPLYKSHAIEKNSIVISFDHVGSGLEIRNNLDNFEIAGVDKVFHKAKASIKGNTIVVSSNRVSQPIHIRYGWSDTFEASLFNKEGLPASSFSSH